MALESIIQSIGYFGVAGIVFAESGLLIGFFLPGDSLLFTAGFLASQGYMNIWVLSLLCFAAAVIGDSVGYAFGHRVGRKLFLRSSSRFFKQEHLQRAEAFYGKYGAKTIIIARFVPFVRTFAPIVAGIGSMSYAKFLTYNIVGGAIWALGLTWMGYLAGGLVPNVDRYLLPVIGLIIILSVLPGVLEALKTPERRHATWTAIRSFFRRPRQG